MSHKVSIITPFLDARRFLAEAVESVLAQTHGDWELLLVDDGSTDGSVELAHELARRAPDRIVVAPAAAKRLGAAAARNRGIALASGSLLAFLDADDVWLPEKLERDVAVLAADLTAACVYSASRWWHDGLDARDWTERLGVALDHTYRAPHLFIRVLMEERGDIPCTCAVTARKSAVTSVGGFEERFALYEDQSLWAKLFLTYPAHVRSGCDARYRQHPASASLRATHRGDYDATGPHRARVEWLTWLLRYAIERDAREDVVASIRAALAEADGPPRLRLRRRLRRMGRYLPKL